MCVCVCVCTSGCALVFGPCERHVCVPLIPLKGPSGRILGHENARSNTNVITRTDAHTRVRTPALEDSDGADISLLEGPVLSNFVGKVSSTLSPWMLICSESVLKRAWPNQFLRSYKLSWLKISKMKSLPLTSHWQLQNGDPRLLKHYQSRINIYKNSYNIEILSSRCSKRSIDTTGQHTGGMTGLIIRL